MFVHLWFTLGVSALQVPFYITLQSVIGSSGHKYHFCYDKHAFVMTKYIFCIVTKVCLPRQKKFSHSKIMFVTTKIFLLRQNVCHDKYVSPQTHVCHDKHMFVVTKDVLSCQTCGCHDKSKLVVTKLCLSRQVFVMPNLSQQAWFCQDKRHVHDKSFVMTEMMLVAASTSNNSPLRHLHYKCAATSGTLSSTPADWSACIKHFVAWHFILSHSEFLHCPPVRCSFTIVIQQLYSCTHNTPPAHMHTHTCTYAHTHTHTHIHTHTTIHMHAPVHADVCTWVEGGEMQGGGGGGGAY